jgi:hypothetical protein
MRESKPTRDGSTSVWTPLSLGASAWKRRLPGYCNISAKARKKAQRIDSLRNIYEAAIYRGQTPAPPRTKIGDQQCCDAP